MTIQSISVIGAGTMGHGIAQVAAQAGYSVFVYDIEQGFVDRGLAAVAQNLDKGIERGKVTLEQKSEALGRIRGGTQLRDAAASADLLIEAVPENLALKGELYANLAPLAPKRCIFASNTSSLSIGKLAALSGRADRFIGMHFFNPVHVMKLLEIVVAEPTSAETLDACKAVGERLGKDCIVVKDFPGFATSRLGVCLGLEAIRMVEQGVASAADIDKAMTLGYGHPMGPLRLSDLVGLDVRLAIADYLHTELASDVFRAPELMRRMVAEGKLGKKSGKGFYEW
jgi:3-hydroxybutyryl-CoA dehydrogenase